jgi:hypothetical protein
MPKKFYEIEPWTIFLQKNNFLQDLIYFSGQHFEDKFLAVPQHSVERQSPEQHSACESRVKHGP